MDLEDILREVIGNEIGQRPKAPDRDTSVKLLTEFLDARKQDIKQGDYVRLNRLGTKRYKIPMADMTAVVVKRFEIPVIDDDGVSCDLQVAVAVQKDVVLTYLMDSGYLAKADGPSNVFKLRGL